LQPIFIPKYNRSYRKTMEKWTAPPEKQQTAPPEKQQTAPPEKQQTDPSGK
jgi:hypothetical protein